jgi:hypothetical protein
MATYCTSIRRVPPKDEQPLIDKDCGVSPSGSIVYNRALIDLARHFGFHPKACRPYRAKTKGKVERPFRYIREDFFLARSFSNLEDLNRQLQRHRQVVGERRVELRFRSGSGGPRNVSHLIPDLKGLSTGRTVSSSGDVCREAQEVGNLIVDRTGLALSVGSTSTILQKFSSSCRNSAIHSRTTIHSSQRWMNYALRWSPWPTEQLPCPFPQ